MSGHNKTPRTIEGMINSLRELKETYPDGFVPYEDCIVPTHEFFLHLCERIVSIEKRIGNG